MSGAEIADQSSGACSISVIVPVFNEAENVTQLCREIHAALEPLSGEFEVVFVNDGSTDGTSEGLAELGERYSSVRVINLRRNSGQTAALSAGMDLASGRVLIPMDGDLQNDPQDIPRLLEKIDEGFDVVSGWRRDRKDPYWNRRFPSIVANWIIARLTGVRLHDFGCTLKAYRRDVLEGVRLYGEMHRFVPIYAVWQGASVTEIEVHHRPRERGVSKYGVSRSFRVVLDLVLLRFLERYSQRPMHLFGGFGLLSMFLASLTFALAAFFKIVKSTASPESSWYTRYGKDFVETPLPVLVVLFGLTGILSLLMGLLAEMVMRTYFESQDKRTYAFKVESPQPRTEETRSRDSAP